MWQDIELESRGLSRRSFIHLFAKLVMLLNIDSRGILFDSLLSSQTLRTLIRSIVEYAILGTRLSACFLVFFHVPWINVETHGMGASGVTPSHARSTRHDRWTVIGLTPSSPFANLNSN